MDNKNKTNKKEKEKQTKNIQNNNQSNSTNIINNNNDERKSKKIKRDLSSKNLDRNKEEKEKEKGKKFENNEIEEKIKNFNNIEKSNKDENIEDNHINQNLKENNKNEINDMNIKNNNYEDIKDINEPILGEDNDELDNLDLDNFSKKLEDFQLLYNDEYIKSIKEEDFSLEIELYIEKLIELITEYHIQIEEKDLEYQLIKNMYQKNIEQYLETNKLLKKLQLIKDDYNLKKYNPKPINDLHDKNYINNLITNKAEINMFNFILYSQKEKDDQEKKEQLRLILKNLLNKPKHKNIINQNEKINKWVQKNINKQNKGSEKNKKKGKQPKIQQDNKDNKDNKNKDKGGNKNDKKKKNTSNSKSKNKINKNVPEEKGKKK